MKKVEQSLSNKIDKPIFYVIVVNAVEGWLLADTETIKNSLEHNANVNISPSATLDCKPKELLKKFFTKLTKILFICVIIQRLQKDWTLMKQQETTQAWLTLWKNL